MRPPAVPRQRPVPSDEDWRVTMVEWAEAIHDEVRDIRRMVQVVFAVWLIGLVGGLVAVVVAAQS